MYLTIFPLFLGYTSIKKVVGVSADRSGSQNKGIILFGLIWNSIYLSWPVTTTKATEQKLFGLIDTQPNFFTR